MATPAQLAQALSHQGEIRNTPQNRFLGAVADVLKPVSEFLDRDKISDRIPFLGGLSAADLTGVKGTESLVRDMSYGTPPIRGATLNTVKVDPRLLDVAGLGGAMLPVAKNLGKAALREGARQIETGTGIIGKNVIDPRTRMFAGEGAKTADKQALKVAKDMKAAGVPDETIHAKTKWFFGSADGKPRFEIDDSAAAYRPGAVRAKVNELNQQMFDESVHARQLRNIMDEQGVGVGDAKAVFKEKFGREPMQGAGAGAKYSEAWKLKVNEDEYYKRLMSKDVSGKTDEFLNHPELYKGYPDTGVMPTHITGDMANKGFGGEFTGTSIKLNPDYAYGMESGKSTTLHELQHAIQQRENFARGGSPDMFMRGYQNKLQGLNAQVTDINQQMRAASGTPQYDELMNARSVIVKQIQAIEGRDGLGALDAANKDYRRLAGEAEARLTQSRMNMTEAERAASYPPSMFDVPVKDQIVRYGDGQAMSVPTDYKGLHTAPMKNSGAPLHDLTGGGTIYPDDIYSPKAAQYYGTGEAAMDRNTMRIINSFKGKPDAQATMYRAVPSNTPDGALINNGDWVTVNKEYAKQHGESALNGDYRILESKVPARNLFTNGDSIHEFGYDQMSVPERNGVGGAMMQGLEGNPKLNVMPNKRFALVEGNSNLRVEHKPDGTFTISHSPAWGETGKPFALNGDSVDDLISKAESRLQRSEAAMTAAAKVKNSKTVGGMLEMKHGDNFEYAKSARSNSQYITHTPTGAKIRISDHKLPDVYESADFEVSNALGKKEQAQSISKFLDDYATDRAKDDASIGVGGAMIQRPKTEFEILHDTAQRNAALPVEQGGLGLPANNTAMHRAAAQYPYVRRSQSQNSPFNDTEYGMFVEHNGAPENVLDDLRNYGKGEWFGRPDANVADVQKDIVRSIKSRGLNDSYQSTAAQLAREANPADIVNSAGMWDAPDLAAVVIEDLMKKGIGAVSTRDGMIAWSPSNIRSRFAAFDPFRRNASDILAGVGVGGLLDPQAIAEALRQQDRK